MQIEQVEMTPAMAREILGHNDNNRNPDERAIQKLVVQMASGKWVLNGDTIVISESGRLLDGQHRLTAVVLSRSTVPMLVARGARDSVFTTIDTGRSRKATDIALLAGVANRFDAMAAAKTIYSMVHGISISLPVAPSYYLEVLERFPSLEGWCSRFRHARAAKALIGAGTLIPALVYLSDIAKRPELAARLIDGIEKGVNLSSGDPILAVRNRIINMRGRKMAIHTATTWPMFARTLDALESGENIFQVKAERSTTITRPKLYKRHMKDLGDRMNLVDLPPPYQIGKIRSQADIMQRVGGK